MKYNKDILDRFLTEKVVINVETQQEWNDFMKLLEKETYCKWSNNNMPTYRNYWTERKECTSVAFNFNRSNSLGFGTGYFYKEEGCEVIKYKDLIKGGETMNEIDINEVVKAWQNTSDDKLNFENNDEGIRVTYPNGLYYLINPEQVYSNRQVFILNVEPSFKAINLTVEYLKNRQINESVKATK